MAAVSVSRTTTALGAFFRRLAARIGKAKAVTATARKIAVVFYKHAAAWQGYVDPARTTRGALPRRTIDNLRRRAGALGIDAGRGHADWSFLGKRKQNRVMGIFNLAPKFSLQFSRESHEATR